MEKIRELVTDFRSGKIELGKELTTACISVFKEGLKQKNFVREREKYIIEIMSRPIDPLTTNFLEAALKANTEKKIKELLKSTEKYLKDSRKNLILKGKSLFKGKKTVMVLGYSKTLAELVNGDKSMTAYVPELSPNLLGHKMAKLINNSILIPDSAIGYFMPSIDMVVSRSCCVATTGLLGSTSAKAAAIIANFYEVPVYMAAELLRIGESFVVTEHKWGVGMENRAPLYDKVEPELITGIITEKGILTHEEYLGKARKKKGDMVK